MSPVNPPGLPAGLPPPEQGGEALRLDLHHRLQRFLQYLVVKVTGFFLLVPLNQAMFQALYYFFSRILLLGLEHSLI